MCSLKISVAGPQRKLRTYHWEIDSQGPEANSTDESNQVIEERQDNGLKEKQILVHDSSENLCRDSLRLQDRIQRR